MAKRKQRQKKQHPYAALSDFGGGTYYSEELITSKQKSD